MSKDNDNTNLNAPGLDSETKKEIIKDYLEKNGKNNIQSLYHIFDYIDDLDKPDDCFIDDENTCYWTSDGVSYNYEIRDIKTIINSLNIAQKYKNILSFYAKITPPAGDKY